jgi:hypothetical protein
MLVLHLNRTIRVDQSLVGSVVIDAEFGREDHNLIPTTTIRKRLKPLYTWTDPEPSSIW